MERHPGRLRDGRLLAILLVLAVATVWTSGSAADADVSSLDGRAVCCVSAVRVDPPEPPAAVRSVGFVGDSLSVGVTDDRFQVGPPIQVVVRAGGQSMWTDTTVGMNMSSGLDSLVSRREQVEATDVVVIALGTNDITGGTDRAAWRRSIDRIVTEVTRSRPAATVVWVDLDFPRLASIAAAFNDVLDAAARSSTALEVCDWQSAVSANPQWLGFDRLHLNGVGYAARRDVIVACIDAVATG